MQDIEVIARAVIRRDDKILLARAKGVLNTFLPGGHIEKGEFSRETLKRELMEELGALVVVQKYIGTLEYIYWRKEGEKVQEINLIFEVNFIGREAVSKEDKLEFMWVNIEDLETSVLLPEPLPILLRNWFLTSESFYECMIEGSNSPSFSLS